MRESVRSFAFLMEARLAENDHKGGWADCPRADLKAMLLQEIAELFEADAHMDDYGAAKEAVDAANFCMMLWTRYAPNYPEAYMR